MSIRRVESSVVGASQNGRLHEVLSVGYAQPRLVNPWEGPWPAKTPLAPLSQTLTDLIAEAIKNNDVTELRDYLASTKPAPKRKKLKKRIITGLTDQGASDLAALLQTAQP